VFEDVDFGAGDAAAIDFFDREGGSEVEGGGGVVKDLRIEAGVEEGSEEHVTTDAGEAVEVGDAHGGYCFMVRWRSLLRLQILLDERLKGVKFRRFPFLCFSGAIERYLRYGAARCVCRRAPLYTN